MLCRRYGPHTTIYWEPKAQHLKHLIGTRCNFDQKYYRYYNKASYNHDLLAHNRRHQDFELPNHLINNYQLPTYLPTMVVDPQLTLDAFLPNPHPTQPTPLISKEVCQGVNAVFATAHNTRMNRGCPHKACFDCCNKLGTLACLPHEAQARKKTREAVTDGIEGQQSEQPTPLITAAIPTPHSRVSSNTAVNDENQSTHPTTKPSEDLAPSTQAGRTFTRRLSPTELSKFRSVSINKQAEERIQNDALALAKKLVTMVVWPGNEQDPFGSETWHVQANKWPLFSLDESEELLSLVESRLGANWKGGLRVWNHEEHGWVHIKMSTQELYPKDCKKILVLLPNVKPSNCEGIDHHLASVAPISEKAAMDIRPMITPTQQSRTSLSVTPTPSRTPISITPIHSQLNTTSSSSPTHISDSEDERDVATMNLINDAVVKATTGNEGSSSPIKSRRAQWPRGVTMHSMVTFFERSMRKQTLMKVAWEEQFQSSYTYASSTVSTYRALLKGIGLTRLTEYVEKHGDHTVQQAKDYFDDVDNRTSKRARQ
ncbi:uncharacterized protein MELLADRAFT_111292 [Melampsora larici-populina 98AG31]|uniref:Uncharacterized protein n=1 Tax=Melampsora larici-populina (strain 98AG31 / pathotype 3-4-7) TaxID=747676 RepID=F4S2N4_MELLP|nr:uncharacterized protein MELLADRAFT_111292 [Melampsora larici-populina 98AG31]EGG01031.1 hypothetical protein MELLADRAFT_111292 [Melampsora larici-populina 98AG31]